MLGNLLTESRNPASREIDRLPTLEVLQILNAEDQKVASAVAAQLPQIARAVDAMVSSIEQEGSVYYIGAGTSGRLGVLDASECPPTYNVPYELIQGIIAGGEAALSRATEASEDDPVLGAKDLLGRGFKAGDVLVGIAASGRTPYVLGAVRKAKEMGAATVGIACVPDSELSKLVDIPIEPIVGPEVVTGSTRMKAGTATKLVLNMLSTGAMIRLGYVYGNLMVNVQPKNEKLADRAVRIIAEAADVSYEEAKQFLSRGGTVKTAIVMAKKGLDRAAAEKLLADARGRIRTALGE